MLEKILNIFGNKKDASTQQESEATILLATLLYRTDKKINLAEQDFMDKLVDGMEWNSGINIEAFRSDAIRLANNAIKNDQISAFVNDACSKISANSELIEILKNLAQADGEINSLENEILAAVKKALMK